MAQEKKNIPQIVVQRRAYYWAVRNSHTKFNHNSQHHKTIKWNANLMQQIMRPKHLELRKFQ